MKTILISTIVLAGLVSPAMGQERSAPPRGDQRERRAEDLGRLPHDRKEQLRNNLHRFQQLSPEQQQQLRERFQQLQRRKSDLPQERIQKLREQIQGRLHRRAGPEAPQPTQPNARPGVTDRRGGFHPGPDAVREGGNEARRIAAQKREEILNRVKNSGNEALYNRLVHLPLHEFFQAVRQLAAQGHRPGAQDESGLRRPGRPTPPPPDGARPSDRAPRNPDRKAPDRRGDEKRPPQRQGGGDRRGGA